jgi:hypothetical protein
MERPVVCVQFRELRTVNYLLEFLFDSFRRAYRLTWCKQPRLPRSVGDSESANRAQRDETSEPFPQERSTIGAT